MQLYLHPTRHEALTATDTTLTRWSLATNPPTILAEMPTTPESVFTRSYDRYGRIHTRGGMAGSPDGKFFALEQLRSNKYWSQDPPVIEWRSIDDFSLARTSTISNTCCEIASLASSSDSRWLVLACSGQIVLLDWQTGEIISRHATRGYSISGLTFDPTSTFVAGLSCNDTWGFLMLWRLDPVARFVRRPPVKDWPTGEFVQQDEVSGSMALTLVHESLDLEDIDWPDGETLADTTCRGAFSPDSQIVVFSLYATYSGCGPELVAFEVPSGKRLWRARSEGENPGPVVFSPDGSVLLVPGQDGDLLMYRVEDGTLVQRLPTNLGEPVQALAFDHDGKTLWLATEEQLVQYQPPG
jgi:WD40 repeat protein